MDKTFGTLIRELRKKRGLTVRRFAIEAGLSHTFISGMERGVLSPPSEAKVKAIAELLDQNPDEMLALTGRVSSDVLEIILQKPKETTALIRKLNHASAAKRKNFMGVPSEEGTGLGFYTLESISQENHTVIIGETGSGKSLLARHLIKSYFKGANIRVYDSDAAPRDWPGIEVIGRKGNYKRIAENMLLDLEELAERTALHGDGLEAGKEIVRVIEEYPSTAAELAELGDKNIRVDIGNIWLRKLLRRGRKYKIKVFAVAQEFEVNAWKIAGEGGLRKAFTVLYLGSTAYGALSSIKDTKYREQLRAYFDSIKYPCLADVKGRFYPVEIPTLKG
jgi:transcriptional regulator with XRE-family HTH domain/GTPase SAR1 family protein